MTDRNWDGTKVKNPYQSAVDEGKLCSSLRVDVRLTTSVPTIHEVLARLKQDEQSERQRKQQGHGTKRKASVLDMPATVETARGGIGDMLAAGFELEREQ